jgi:hypothetical protein
VQQPSHMGVVRARGSDDGDFSSGHGKGKLILLGFRCVRISP